MGLTRKDFYMLLPKVGVSLVICLAIGFIVWQSNVFHWYSAAFRFVMFGIIGSTFFLILRLDRRDAWTFLLVASAINTVLITRTAKWPSVFAYILFTIAIAVAVYLYSSYFYRRNVRKWYLELFIIAILFAIGSVIVDTILNISNGTLFDFPLKNWLGGVWYFFLMGLGIGLSILFTDEPLWSRLRKSFERVA
jgi:hypothetical protein